MRARSSYFFATRGDLSPGLRSAERARPLKYVLGGMFASPELPTIPSALLIPDLGIAKRGDQVGEDRYLVVEEGTEVHAREVAQRRGGVLYAVDHIANPGAILFRPGGVFQGRCLISGEVIGVGDPRSLALYAFFTPLILAGFERIKRFYVGPEAARLLDAGMRLTQRVRAPVESDLKREGPQEVPARVQVSPLRRSLDSTWQWLEQRGFDAPRNAAGMPVIPADVPGPDELRPGLSFMRTALEGEALGDLTLPHTFFARSEFRRVSFRNTDLRESRMCWNDWLECDFSQADLTGADLRASVYERCRFVGAILTGADLRWSRFDECDFTEAQMESVKLTYVRGAGLGLTARQRDEIAWQSEDGPEPPGG